MTPDIHTRSDPVTLASALIRCPSVTPEDHGALDLLQGWLEALGFVCERMMFADEDAPPVDNLYARLGTSLPNFCFAGHTDVVPPGAAEDWDVPPFEAMEQDGMLLGRGASDMKGAIGCFVSAVAEYLKQESPKGSISLLITGDEEALAINGTRKVLEALRARGEEISHCIIGEPSNPQELGEMIKVGRRGSYNAVLTVNGVQGHVAYPGRAENPIPHLMTLLQALTAQPLDDGYEHFQPSNLVISALNTPSLAENVIPGWASARFNVRFNPTWTGAGLDAYLREIITKAAAGTIRWDLKGRHSGEAFLSSDEGFPLLISRIVKEVTGRQPELSTSGGTSDGRFLHLAAPVAEFGLVGATMHKVNERVSIADMHSLQRIYLRLLQDYFSEPS
ncbi:succinyl-diaminopimelate desuccinylase [Parvularcula sp. IMCC14364]|uniref:succinyl-diaminopimelate desuccinylase n=1 Tax=Parvularcula sp. IMCC14364 TaxID=3067902 RepID=UPI002741AF64|nr:succinyl-diaminopimelate desuccinylase [Parvularcula sp. IMCC14364]